MTQLSNIAKLFGRNEAELELADVSNTVKPVSWFNGCDTTVPAALRYLADFERPSEGQQRFNAEHLFQLADEIETMAEMPLYNYRDAGKLKETEIVESLSTRFHCWAKSGWKNDVALTSEQIFACMYAHVVLNEILGQLRGDREITD